MDNILIWYMRMSRVFLLPLSFPFPLPFYSRYLLRFIFFLAAVKSWVLDKAWKWDPDQLQV